MGMISGMGNTLGTLFMNPAAQKARPQTENAAMANWAPPQTAAPASSSVEAKGALVDTYA